jgi:hypothetical protein
MFSEVQHMTGSTTRAVSLITRKFTHPATHIYSSSTRINLAALSATRRFSQPGYKLSQVNGRLMNQSRCIINQIVTPFSFSSRPYSSDSKCSKLKDTQKVNTNEADTHTDLLTEVVDANYSHPDGLTRYPTMGSANGMLRGLDWLGNLCFER